MQLCGMREQAFFIYNNIINLKYMKQIDFSKLDLEVKIGVFQNVDTRKDLGNMLFNNANSLELDALSRRIFDAPNKAIELNDAEYGMMMQSLRSSGARYSVIKALENAEKPTEKTTKKLTK